MNDEQITIEVAKLNGWKSYSPGDFNPTVRWEKNGSVVQTLDLPEYLYSRDAIIPVIEKVVTPELEMVWVFFFAMLDEQREDSFCGTSYLFATARELCIALLKSTGNWKDL